MYMHVRQIKAYVPLARGTPLRAGARAATCCEAGAKAEAEATMAQKRAEVFILAWWFWFVVW